MTRPGSHPRVSVVIPFHQNPVFLPETLEGLVAQTFEDFEVCLADDGSTEPYPDFAASFGDRLDLTILRLPHKGVSAARNAAARAARGEFVAFLDADDVWLPDKLSLQVRMLESDPGAVLCYGNLWFIDDRGRDLGRDLCDQHGLKGLPEEDALAVLLEKSFLQPSTIVMNRERFLEMGGFDETLRNGEDWDFALRAARIGRLRAVSKPIVLYRRHPGAVTLQGKHTEDLLVVIGRALALARPRDRPALEAHHRAWWLCLEAFWAAYHGKAVLASYRFLSAVRASPRTAFSSLKTRFLCWLYKAASRRRPWARYPGGPGAIRSAHVDEAATRRV